MSEPGNVRLDYSGVVSVVGDDEGNGEGSDEECREQCVADPPPVPQRVAGEDAHHEELHVTSQVPREQKTLNKIENQTLQTPLDEPCYHYSTQHSKQLC